MTPAGWSDRVNEVAGDMVPDEPVLTPTAGFQQITVSWPAVTGAERYELWAWDGAWTALHVGAFDPLAATTHVHTGLSTGRTYYYQGRAVDSAGVMSAWSAQVSATVLSAPNISAPTSFNAARGDEQVTLTWTAATAPAGQTIARYEYQHVASSGTFADSWTNVGNVTTATVTGLTNGTAYKFEVRAVSNTGATGNAGSASATPATVPGSPTLTATAADYDENRAHLDGSRQRRRSNHQLLPHRVAEHRWVLDHADLRRAGSVLTWTDTGLDRATPYTYRIFAVNDVGDSQWTSSTATHL